MFVYEANLALKHENKLCVWNIQAKFNIYQGEHGWDQHIYAHSESLPDEWVPVNLSMKLQVSPNLAVLGHAWLLKNSSFASNSSSLDSSF